ncbi:MAG TPA: hypothetical protein VM100_14035 [Longimicrobiales bacterium]|nr:hypothetical protein [Longimicrobiales bacterium]
MHAYIPFAQRLRNDGWDFLRSPDAVHLPVFSYVWPAMFGANLEIQKLVSSVLSAIVLAMLFRSGQLIHSSLAGLLCAAAYAFSPLVWPLAATAGVEPLFLFLTAGWVWALAEGAAGRRWGFAIAAVAIALGALTRASVLYVLPILVITAFLLSRYGSRDQALWRSIARTHAIAIAAVLPLVAVNAYRFGLFAVSTGAGATLFSGLHPLVYGFEQHYFDIIIDLGDVLPPGMSHLDVAGDRLLASVGKFMLLSMSPQFVAQMLMHKLFAFLFVSNREWVEPTIYLRSYRILLFVIAIMAFRFIRTNPVLLCVATVMTVHTLLHMPALFSFRYSVLCLEVGLALVAGVGLAWMVHTNQRTRLLSGGIVAVAAGAIGAWHAAYSQIPSINVYGSPHTVLERFSVEHLPVTALDGMTKIAPGRYRFDAALAAFDVDLSGRNDLDPYHPVFLAVAADSIPGAPSASCDHTYVSFRALKSTPEFGPPLRYDWIREETLSRLIIGGVWKLKFNQPGFLRLSFACDIGSEMQITGMELLQSTVGREYLAQYLQTGGAPK